MHRVAAVRPVALDRDAGGDIRVGRESGAAPVLVESSVAPACLQSVSPGFLVDPVVRPVSPVASPVDCLACCQVFPSAEVLAQPAPVPLHGKAQ
jgi:hypothetical protein